jgi:hypothetical protein
MRSLPGDGQTSPISRLYLPSLVVFLAQTLVVDTGFQSTVQIERVPAQDLGSVFGDIDGPRGLQPDADAVCGILASMVESVKIT